MEGTSASLSPVHHNQNAAASTTGYQVFINHRGPDVKSTLADLIYHRLHEKGLQVFLDKDEFHPGQPLNPTIEEAIRSSSVHIAIFSKRYAESDWCLKELRLMLETGAPIIPVFYKVQPSDLIVLDDIDNEDQVEALLVKDLTVLELFQPKIEGWPLHGEQVRLRELRLAGTNLISISIPQSVCLCLEHLDLSSNDQLMEVNYLPPTLLKLNFLFCKKLEHIQALEHLPRLRALNLSRCSELRELPALGHLLSLETIDVSWCSNLHHIQALENLLQLRALNLSGCSELRELPALQHLLCSELLDVSYCTNLQHIQGLEHLPQILALNLSGCSSELSKLPALQHLLSLGTLDGSHLTIGGLFISVAQTCLYKV